MRVSLVTGALIVVGLILLTAAVFAWARISAARAEGRSIETYGHALGVLGDVSRRGESSGSVRILTRDTTHGAHVRATGAVGEFPAPVAPRPGQSPQRPVPAAPAPVIPRISLAVPARPLRFDDTVAPALTRQLAGPSAASPGGTRPGSPDEVGPGPPDEERADLEGEDRADSPGDGRADSPGPRWRQVSGRRLASASAAGVAVLLATVGALQLTGGGHPAAGTGGGTTRPGHNTPPAAPATSHSGSGALDPSGAAQRLVPTSTTTTDVSFRVPSRTYLLTFSDIGTTDCWVGVETAAGSGGAWLWMETLTPGSTTSYKASGPVVADVGAPKNIELLINGVAAELPGYAGSYDLSFTTGTASA